MACSREQHADTEQRLLHAGFIGTGDSKRPVGPEGWAHERGSLAGELSKLGFAGIQFVRFGNGPDLNEALSGGSLDIGIYGDTPALVGRAAGLATRLINQTAMGLDAWLLARPNGPGSVAELAGKTVATSKGSYMHRYLAGLLLDKGLSEQVKFAHLLPADAAVALRKGDIAAYAAPSQTAPLLVAEGARVIDRASDHPGLSGSSVTVVTNAFLDQHQRFPAAWNRLRASSVDDLKAKSEQYYAFHAANVRVPVEVAKISYPLALFASEPLTPAGLRLLDGTKRFLFQQGLAQSDFSLTDWVLPEVLPAHPG